MHMIKGRVVGPRDLTTMGIGGEHLPGESREVIVPLAMCALFLRPYNDGHHDHEHESVAHARFFPGFYTPAASAEGEPSDNSELIEEGEDGDIEGPVRIFNPELGSIDEYGVFKKIPYISE